MALWAYNTARVEEEIARRQESSTVASQVGRTHHLHLTSETAARQRGAAARSAARPSTAGATPADAAGGGGSATATAALPKQQGVARTAQPSGHRQLADGTCNPSLSPYDHL
eukprot:Rhum_TRINITY_DN2902_c1_g1::Rhum_TRINITY_DN2902_c1_g1_i1::g.8821::m.8821